METLFFLPSTWSGQILSESQIAILQPALIVWERSEQAGACDQCNTHKLIDKEHLQQNNFKILNSDYTYTVYIEIGNIFQ